MAATRMSVRVPRAERLIAGARSCFRSPWGYGRFFVCRSRTSRHLLNSLPCPGVSVRAFFVA